MAFAEKALKICEQVALQRIDGLKEEVETLKTKLEHALSIAHQYAETIKGLDRATVEYTRIIAEKDERIASLLEAQAIVPTRDVNGTIEALHGLVAKLKGDVLKLQAKVTEQEDTIALLKPRPVDLSQPVAGTSGSEVVDILMNDLDSRSHEQMK